MILLTKCFLDDNLYTIGTADGPSDGSTTDLYKNIFEMANVLDPFEVVYNKAIKNTELFNMTIDKDVAIDKLKPLHQAIRHGLAFDYVMNYVMKLISDQLPTGSIFPIFKKTQPFIDQFISDPVFANEIKNLEQVTKTLIDWVYGDKSVDYLNGLDFNNLAGDDIELFKRTHYLVFMLNILFDSIGQVVQQHWTDHFAKMSGGFPFTETDVIAVGCRDRIFLYGNIDNTDIKWHVLENGIGMSGSYRTHRKEYIRVLPDEMTFIRIENDTLYIDETYFPVISIDDGEFINAVDFGTNGVTCSLDTPHKLTIKYKFKQDPNNPKTIKLTSGENCIIKDASVVLDQNGEAISQIMFRGASTTFKIVDKDKKYPFSVFTSSKLIVNKGAIPWA